MTQTTQVYRLRYAEGFEWLLPENEVDFDLLRFDGKARASGWTPIKMKRVRISEHGQVLKQADFPACSGGDMLIVGHRAKSVLGMHLEKIGELLPLLCDEGDFWALNVTRLVDVLDELKSDLLRASNSGSVLRIRKHQFRPSDLSEEGFFKLHQTPRGLIYASTALAETIATSGLVGLDLVKA